MSADSDLMIAALERYQERFRAVHGSLEVITNMGGADADRLTFGDIIDPEVLNGWNKYYITRYIELWLERLPDEVRELVTSDLTADDESENYDSVVSSLAPVLFGLFEHVFLHGWMYRDEGLKTKRWDAQ
jgi:hypothetical protein